MDLRWDILAGYGPLFVAGLWMTVKLTIVAIGVGLLLGILLGLISSSADAPPPKSVLGAWALRIARGITLGYVTFFRGTPLFVQILLVHFALMPALIHPDGGLLLSGEAAREFRQAHGAFFSGALAMTLNAGAYMTEIVRGGIQSVDKGQMEAARSLGIGYLPSMRKVILPQAIRTMIPSYINQFVITLKDTSILSVIGIAELTQTGRIIIARNFQSFNMWLIIGIIYFVVIMALTKLSDRLEKRLVK